MKTTNLLPLPTDAELEAERDRQDELCAAAWASYEAGEVAASVAGYRLGLAGGSPLNGCPDAWTETERENFHQGLESGYRERRRQG